VTTPTVPPPPTAVTQVGDVVYEDVAVPVDAMAMDDLMRWRAPRRAV
jgi:hypothetical protein